MARRFQIVSGPSKLDLMLALFDSPYDKPRPVNFSLVAWPEGQPATGPQIHLQLHVMSVEKEDGSGESWNVEAAAWAPESKDYKMCYSTRNRTGVAQIK